MTMMQRGGSRTGWRLHAGLVGLPGLLVLLVACSRGQAELAPGQDAAGADGATATADGSAEPDLQPDASPTAPDTGGPAPDKGLPVKPVCLAAPLPLSRFAASLRTTSTGRTFSGWGGASAATLASPLPAQKIPVVFVHGNGGSADDFISLRQDLCKQGYTDQEIWAITFQDNSCYGTCLSGSNTQHAAELAVLVKLVRGVTKAKRVAIVAQSMGVTTARHYLKFMGGTKEVALAYLVSGPNHGLSSCDFAGATLINVACAEVSSTTLYAGWLYDLNTPDETPSGQGDGLAAQSTVTYRVLTYALDPYFLGLYLSSPLLDGADNLVLPGAIHGEVDVADLLTYLAKLPAVVP